MNDWKEFNRNEYDIDVEFDNDGGLESVSYRKRQPKAPSHEEIMTKWWKDGAYWEKVYRVSEHLYLMTGTGLWVGKNWFTGRESADIPPEAAE